MKKMFRFSPARVTLIGLVMLSPSLTGCSALICGCKTTCDSGTIISPSDLTTLQKLAWRGKLTEDYVQDKFGTPNRSVPIQGDAKFLVYEGVRSAEIKGGADFIFSFDDNERSQLSRVVFTIDACGKVLDVEPYGTHGPASKALELHELQQSNSLNKLKQAVQQTECDLCNDKTQLQQVQAALQQTKLKLDEKKKKLADAERELQCARTSKKSKAVKTINSVSKSEK